jgi:1-acyl-sn-glycerol-3-phosphate acyltransferase
MPSPITHAQPPLEFIPPAFNSIALQGMRSLVPLYRRWRAHVTEVKTTNVETLATLYQQFQAGEIRLLLAFRHPSTNDPLCMAHLLWGSVPKVARQRGIRLDASAVHAHFIYDRGIPLWAGEAIGWLYSRLGGTPIRRGRVDIVGLRSIRQLFAEGQFPMAAAPEGATNGHNEIVSPIEPGIAQFGFWCIEDQLKEGRSLPVVIAPIGIQYSFAAAPWKSLERLLSQLESDAGIKSATSEVTLTLQNGLPPTEAQTTELYQRFYRLAEHLLFLMERFYHKFYHQALPAPLDEAVKKTPPQGATPLTHEQLAEHLQRLLNAVLSVAEQYFNLTPKGSITDRCRRLEQAGWDWIYREDLKHLETLSIVERGLADRIAEEANLRLWHMRLVETFVSVTGHYVVEKPTAERFADTLLLLWEMIARISDRPSFPRPVLGQQHAHVTVGEPINVSERWESYQANRRQAVATLTQDLQTALEKMIH